MPTIFAISLPRSAARHQHIKNELSLKSKLPFELLGIDGAELRNSGAPWPHKPHLRDSEVGCALSHVQACRRIVELNLPAALIVEDDVILPDDIDAILDALSQEIDVGEVIALYNRTMKPAMFSRNNAREIAGRLLLRPMESRNMRTAAAYFIERSAAENIVRLNSPAQVPADNWMFFYQSKAVRSIRLVHPIPVRLSPFNSTLAVDRGNFTERTIKRAINFVPGLQMARQQRRRWLERKRENNIVLTDLPSDMTRNAFD